MIIKSPALAQRLPPCPPSRSFTPSRADGQIYALSFERLVAQESPNLQERHDPLPGARLGLVCQRARSHFTRAVVMPDSLVQSCASDAATLLCTIATADTVDKAVGEVKTAGTSGATAVEIRLDFYRDLHLQNPAAQIQRLLDACREAGLASVFTCRPDWEGYGHLLRSISCHASVCNL